MQNIILASTSSLYGESYLSYLRSCVSQLFGNIKTLIFIPYARPGGISHDDYTQQAASFFKQLQIEVKGLHQFEDAGRAIDEGAGFFTGGGNTFLLVKQLHELGLMKVLKQNVRSGKPYLGTSAGSNIAGINMQTTNDMPIVYPPSFETLGLVPFNLNPHYLDPNPALKHNGETRETRIKEFHSQNNIPVVGLREGSWIRVSGNKITTEGMHSSRIFEQGKEAYELAPGATLDFKKQASSAGICSS
jgi:dipeptidase E